MLKTKTHYLIILLLAIPIMAAAVLMFKSIDNRNILNSSQINCIIKDSRGFIWMGTPAGLYRYDGYTFKSFQSDAQDGTSLADSYIESIQEALDGRLWVKTASGICVYSPQLENFERDMQQVYTKMGIKDNPENVFFDHKKNLWAYIPSRGVIAYNMQKQLLYEFSYTTDAKGIPLGHVSTIGECRDGVLLVYEDGSMICVNIEDGQKVVWKDFGLVERKLLHTTSLKAFADPNDNIWLYGHGTLLMYVKKQQKWVTTIGEQLGMTNDAVDRSVNGMAADRKGNIWIGTDRSGLIKVSARTYEMEQVKPQDGGYVQFNDDINVRCVYVDDSDLLWVGTEKNGAAICGENVYKFSVDMIGDITAICQDDSGRVWMGSNDRGVIGYEGEVASRQVTAMAYTPDGSVWVGSRQNGLTRIKNGQSTIYQYVRGNKNGLADNHINAMCVDNIGNLWIATDKGLQVYNPKMNTFASYTKENGRLHTNKITSLYYASGNRILAGTNSGLVIINISTGDKQVYTGNINGDKKFTNAYITQVIEDSRHLLWIGTRAGLNVLNLDNDNLQHITNAYGLCNNNICGLAEDKNNNVWITTSNGVARAVVQRNHETGTFNIGLYNYNVSDGLQGKEFNVGAICRRKDGNVMFGGLFGVNWIRKHGKTKVESLPKVMLTQLFIDEEEVEVGHDYSGKVILPQALNESKKITLNNSQNTFTLKFAAGNYNQSEGLQFMYWMEGLDDDWRNGDALKHGVTFTNLSSGTYYLHVKAVSADGAVSNQERVLEIHIDRPWWMKWWVILIVLVLMAACYYFYMAVSKKVKFLWASKKMVLGQLILQREEVKNASDDLREPMARMTSIIGSMAERDTSIEGQEQINSLHFQMLQIITRISEMQMALDNPEEKATEDANQRLQLNDNGIVKLADLESEELTANIGHVRKGLITQKYTLIFVDDNAEYLKFVEQRLGAIYNVITYNDTSKAVEDVEANGANIIVCKQEMAHCTGSEFCNMVKTNPRTHNIKFVLVTDKVLTPNDMRDMGITLSADDYLAKPFNLQEAAARFNSLLGLAPNESLNNLIEGDETRRLEGRNSSMTTSTINLDTVGISDSVSDDKESDKQLTTTEHDIDIQKEEDKYAQYYRDSTIGDYSMANEMDRNLMRNVEQYVVHNMSRGQIKVDLMAEAMGMGRVPFFQKIRAITQKTPIELVREIRLKHACMLLENTDINLSELAINIGFLTAENFISNFKEKYGVTPLEYRVKHRKK